MFNVWIIIQARSTSTRFPNKIMADFHGVPLIYYIYRKCYSVSPKTIIAIPKDDDCKNYLIRKNIKYFEGLETDVLNRYYECAKSVKATHIIRITADCPFISYSMLFTIYHHVQYFDFITNLPCPDGYDIEGLSFNALDWGNANLKEPSDREHVTKWFRENKCKDFKKGYFHELYLLEWFPKMSVDTPGDLKRIRELFLKIHTQYD